MWGSNSLQDFSSIFWIIATIIWNASNHHYFSCANNYRLYWEMKHNTMYTGEKFSLFKCTNFVHKLIQDHYDQMYRSIHTVYWEDKLIKISEENKILKHSTWSSCSFHQVLEKWQLYCWTFTWFLCANENINPIPNRTDCQQYPSFTTVYLICILFSGCSATI